MPSGTLSILISVCQCHGTHSQCSGVQTITANCSMEAVCPRCSARPATVPEASVLAQVHGFAALRFAGRRAHILKLCLTVQWDQHFSVEPGMGRGGR